MVDYLHKQGKSIAMRALILLLAGWDLRDTEFTLLRLKSNYIGFSLGPNGFTLVISSCQASSMRRALQEVHSLLQILESGWDVLKAERACCIL